MVLEKKRMVGNLLVGIGATFIPGMEWSSNLGNMIISRPDTGQTKMRRVF